MAKSTETTLKWISSSKKPRLQKRSKKSLTIVDLFCGCGGLTLGAWEAARLAGRPLDIRLALDASESPLEVFKSNFPGTDKFRFKHADISRILDNELGSENSSVEKYWKGRIGDLDVIVAGPPCQGHSDLNNSTRRVDPRNNLYMKVIRAAEVFKPKSIIIENVPAVIHDQKNVVGTASHWLQSKLGYKVTTFMLNVNALGLPQMRKRHILLATKFQPLSYSTPNLPENQSGIGLFLAGLEDEPNLKSHAFYKSSNMSAENTSRVKHLFDHDLYDLPNEFRPPCHRDKKHSYVSMYGRLHSEKPAQTITGGFGSIGQGRYVHPTRQRTLTPHEAARLQGFPDFYDFKAVEGVSALREMIGNAAPPQITINIVTELIKQDLI